MKILLNCHMPFNLAHGGAQIQMEQTKAALDKIGIDAEYLRWWDETQTGDILHQLGIVDVPLARRAHQKGWHVAVTILLTEQCNRTERELLVRKLSIRSALAALPAKLKERLPWESYHHCDRVIVGLEAERMVLEKVYGVPRERISVVPLGLYDMFLNAGPALRTEDHLICTGTIGPAKNSLEIARLATAARTPILFVGKPFDLAGEYWMEFRKLIDGKIVKHHSHVSNPGELIALLQRARGYVLMSRSENWSLAAHEAVGCGLPTLVPDMRWAHERFGTGTRYWPKHGFEASVATLRKFYDDCPRLSPPGIRQYSWVEVAQMLRTIYAQMLETPVLMVR
jgi:glycosyltransferase involved in cell wall biosynthesis